MTMQSINRMKEKVSVVLEVKGVEPEGFQTVLFHVSSRI